MRTQPLFRGTIPTNTPGARDFNPQVKALSDPSTPKEYIEAYYAGTLKKYYAGRF